MRRPWSCPISEPRSSRLQPHVVHNSGQFDEPQVERSKIAWQKTDCPSSQQCLSACCTCPIANWNEDISSYPKIEHRTHFVNHLHNLTEKHLNPQGILSGKIDGQVGLASYTVTLIGAFPPKSKAQSKDRDFTHTFPGNTCSEHKFILLFSTTPVAMTCLDHDKPGAR